MMWFMKPDGDVVKLQGDPGNRAYYEDKGFVPLTPDEVQAWERDKTVSKYDPETGERDSQGGAPPASGARWSGSSASGRS